jgi:hypothetical protein
MAWPRNELGDRISIREYLTATGAVSRPLAILLTVLFFLVSVAVIIGLIFGIRWIYRSASHGGTSTVKVQTTKTGFTAVNSDNPATAHTPTPSTTPTPTATATSSVVPNTGPEPE